MTLKQLEYFTAIVEHGTITAASKKLNISQPPLSLQIKNLEDELGVQLFRREGKTLKITEAGLIFKDRAQQILNMSKGTIREVRDFQAGMTTTLHIGTISSISARILPEQIKKLNERFSGLDYEICEGSSIRIMELIRNGIIELGFIREPYSTSFFQGIEIKDKTLGETGEDYFVAIANSDYFDSVPGDTISLEELAQKPLIYQSRFDDIISKHCKDIKVKPNTICRNNDVLTSLAWANAGLGVAVTPLTSSILLPCEDGNVETRKIVDPVIASQVFLVWDKKKRLSPAAEELIQLFSKPV